MKNGMIVLIGRLALIRTIIYNLSQYHGQHNLAFEGLHALSPAHSLPV